MTELVKEFLDNLFAYRVDDDAWDTYASPKEAIADIENFMSEFAVELAKYLHTPEFKAFVTEQWTRRTQN